MVAFAQIHRGANTLGKRLFFVFFRYFILLLGTAMIAYGIMQFLSKSPEEKTPTAVPVILATPEYGTLQESISLNAHIQSDHMVALLPLVSGELETVSFELGDRVEKDQVLAQIDSEAYEQQRAQAASAKEVAQTTFMRIERLFQAKAVSEQAYEEAKANRDATRAQWELAELQMKNTAIKAPIAGTVIQKYASQGNIASPEQPIALIADQEALSVKAHIPAYYFDIIQAQKDQLAIHVRRTDASGNVHSAKASLQAVAPSIDPSSNTFSLICTLQEQNGTFVPGMAVTIQIIYNQLEGVYLLKQEDRTVGGAFYLYDEETKTARYENITIIAENDFLVAIDPAYKDASFIVGGQHTVLDGQPVSVQQTR
ncbi:efflux RND transporter periplasmic adaptor subunit [Sphaerochaeta halotolerans]|jgi:RND family efflux transporter MFP subunit|uniref:Efflux RND transporter periplasmic adaptor subunit n=1 Tax=Sphaerochaeta halotolerans TaxID=2293840 RepID=A0A372MIT5_9SPIR|nr:efflux RND transporter periplasmic adaptor subunit [Sphaerochaeta halotolerans]